MSKIGEAFVDVVAKLDKLDTGLDKAKNMVGSAVKGMAGVAVGGAAIIGGGLAAVGGGILKLAADAAPIAGIQRGFEGLTSTFEGGSAAMLKALKDASNGLVSNTDLMQSYNMAAQLVGKEFANRLPEAFTYLSRVSASTGQDMGFLLDSLVRGVGRLSPAILDNLAIQVDLTKAYDDYAKSVGKSADELTKAEKQTAAMDAAMEQLAANTEGVAGRQGVITKMSVAFQDLRDELGTRMIPIVAPFTEKLLYLAEKVFPIIILVVEKLANKIIGFSSGILDHVEPVIRLFETFFTLLGNGGDPVLLLAGLISNLAYEFGATKEKALEIRQTIAGFQDDFNAAKDVAYNLFMVFKTAPEEGGPLLDYLQELPPSIQPIVEKLANLQVAFLGFLNETVIPFVKEHGPQLAQILLIAAGSFAALSVIAPVIAQLASFASTLKTIGSVAGIASKGVGLLVGALGGPLTIALAVIAGLIGLVAVAWKENWGGIQDIVMPVVDIVKELVTNIQGGMSVFDALKSFLYDLGQVFGMTTDEAIAFSSTIVNFFLGVQEGLAAGWETIKAILGSALETILPSIQGMFTGAGESLSGFSSLIEPLKGLWSSLVDLFKSLAPIVMGVLQGIGSLFLLLFGVVVGVFRGIMDAIPQLIDTFRIMLTGVIEVVTGIIDTLTGIITFIVGWLKGSDEEMQAGWTKIKEGVIGILHGLAVGVLDGLESLINSIITFVKGLVEGVIEFFERLHHRLVGGSIIPDMVNAIIKWFIDLKEKVIGFVKELWEKAVTLFVDAYTKLRNKVTELVTTILAKVKTFAADLLEKWSELWDDVKTTIHNVVGKALTWLKDKFNEVFDDIIGFIQPALDMWTSFTDAVKGFWDWIKNKVFDFKINLPSLPDWATPGSPLPIHIAWRDFARDMAKINAQVSATVRAEPLPPNTPLAEGGNTYQTTVYVQDESTLLRVLHTSRTLDTLRI